MKNYIFVTAAYWGFTLTDGALRMLVLLHFHAIGYSPLQIAMLFLFYEFFGVVTNLVGGWIGSHMGLKITLTGGLLLQVLALEMLSFLQPEWGIVFSVVYVMIAQALSGIAKDLTKMSSKSAVKLLVPENSHTSLFTWVSILTGSKNALKGAGFFLGGLLLSVLGFGMSLHAMAASLAVIVIIAVMVLPENMGKSRSKVKFTHLFSKSRSINILSTARFFLFGSRDIWFVVGLPIYLSSVLDWSFTQVGTFMALWVIGYGIVQSLAPRLVRKKPAPGEKAEPPRGRTAAKLAFLLALTPLLIIAGLLMERSPTIVLISGLAIYGVIFALNSAVHSYLILAYTESDDVALNVGFYYMANAGGRLAGTVLSGWVYQAYGLSGCLWGAVAFVVLAAIISLRLPSTGSQLTQ